MMHLLHLLFLKKIFKLPLYYTLGSQLSVQSIHADKSRHWVFTFPGAHGRLMLDH